MITKTDIQKAFDNKYITCKNTRTFTNDDEDAQVTEIEATMKNDGTFSVYIRSYEEDKFDILTIDELAEVVKEGWTLEPKTREQIEEEEIAAMPDVKFVFEVEPATYTTKSGYVMNMFFVNIENAELSVSDDIQLDKDVKAMRGWFDKKNKGYMLRSRRDAERVVNYLNQHDECLKRF